MFFR
jgi:hypothetical protein